MNATQKPSFPAGASLKKTFPISRVLLWSILVGVGLPMFHAGAATSTIVFSGQAGNSATTFTVSSAVLPFSMINPAYTGGSITFTLTDTDGNGALLTVPAGAALMDCLIDGTSYHQLGPDPYSLNVPAGDSTTVTLDFGTPIPSLLGPSASDIQTILKLTLSPHDRFSSASLFTVDSSPASSVPDGGSSGALLSLALGAMLVFHLTFGNRRMTASS